MGKGLGQAGIARLNADVENTCTPAHRAVENEDAETLAQLLAKGVDPDEICHDMTLLTHAVDAEGDGALQSGKPLTVHTTAVLLAFGADPQLPGPDGLTPIGLAVSYGHHLAVELLQRHIQRGEATQADEDAGNAGEGQEAARF
ncbi:ankyrin repeat domain-containing protein [Streptomyces sp. NPDC021080]|uniref:ankyrin repeat domain-containing protein n=1 Tax=Streptomyces sp. NPDC021080 TaxID=3365110 RepID=UPI0037899050